MATPAVFGIQATLDVWAMVKAITKVVIEGTVLKVLDFILKIEPFFQLGSISLFLAPPFFTFERDSSFSVQQSQMDLHVLANWSKWF